MLASPLPPSPSTFASNFFFSLTILTILTSQCSAGLTASTTRRHRQISYKYYARSCPQVEQLVASVTSQQYKEAPVSGPATIRLFFHDCFVEVSMPLLLPHIVEIQVEPWIQFFFHKILSYRGTSL